MANGGERHVGVDERHKTNLRSGRVYYLMNEDRSRMTESRRQWESLERSRLDQSGINREEYTSSRFPNLVEDSKRKSPMTKILDNSWRTPKNLNRENYHKLNESGDSRQLYNSVELNSKRSLKKKEREEHNQKEEATDNYLRKHNNWINSLNYEIAKTNMMSTLEKKTGRGNITLSPDKMSSLEDLQRITVVNREIEDFNRRNVERERREKEDQTLQSYRRRRLPWADYKDSLDTST
eukprot:TRINITY_DN12860_c0_g1_i1.p1 TRINITY_DN12860_c0_g1~~TRINITY_DN12860_c0_g1_i1.p1  ORF type:complete len:237 (+),score=23.37 TRINITY_DN12860_c0_g1_i1:426-1136(+)